MTTGLTYRKLSDKIRTFAREELTPKFVQDWQKYRSAIEGPAGAEQKAKAKKTLKMDLLKDAARVAGAGAMYELTAATYGVSGRDFALTFSADKAWHNTSSLSLTVAAAAASLIPPNWKETVADAVIPVEAGLSLIRMYVEQKLWKKINVTPDPAGTLLTPYLAGILELGYKAVSTYPQDMESRIMVGFVGIYGNLVRMANAGMMYLAYLSARGRGEEARQPKAEKEQGGG